MKMFKVVNTDDNADQTPRVVIAKGPASAIAHVSKPIEATAIDAIELHDLNKMYPDLVVEKAGDE